MLAPNGGASRAPCLARFVECNMPQCQPEVNPYTPSAVSDWKTRYQPLHRCWCNLPADMILWQTGHIANTRWNPRLWGSSSCRNGSTHTQMPWMYRPCIPSTGSPCFGARPSIAHTSYDDAFRLPRSFFRWFGFQVYLMPFSPCLGVGPAPSYCNPHAIAETVH